MPDDSASRRFPAPWKADKIPGGYVVRDANGQALAYVYARATIAEAMQAIDPGRSETDCSEYRSATGVAEGWATTAGLNLATSQCCLSVGAALPSNRTGSALPPCFPKLEQIIQVVVQTN
jgi:hypothetical protein